MTKLYECRNCLRQYKLIPTLEKMKAQRFKKVCLSCIESIKNDEELELN